LNPGRVNLTPRTETSITGKIPEPVRAVIADAIISAEEFTVGPTGNLQRVELQGRADFTHTLTPHPGIFLLLREIKNIDDINILNGINSQSQKWLPHVEF
jgi:hypothetical protein